MERPLLLPAPLTEADELGYGLWRGRPSTEAVELGENKGAAAKQLKKISMHTQGGSKVFLDLIVRSVGGAAIEGLVGRRHQKLAMTSNPIFVISEILGHYNIDPYRPIAAQPDGG